MKQLASVRTNINYLIDKKTSKLLTSVELVLLTNQPEYSYNAKGEIKINTSLNETRLTLSVEALKKLISNLELAEAEVNQYEKMSITLNTVIDQITTK